MAPYKGFPDVNSGKEPAQTTDDVRDVGSIPSPGDGRSNALQLLHSILHLPGESDGQRSLVDYSLKDRKELDTTEVT